MKRLLLFLMVFISLFTLSSCNETAQPTVDPTEPTVETPTQGETKDPTEEKPTQGETNEPTQGGSNESGFAIHYLRPDGQYDGWNLWLWVKDGQGAAYQFNVAEDETGVTFKTSWADFGIDDARAKFTHASRAISRRESSAFSPRIFAILSPIFA